MMINSKCKICRRAGVKLFLKGDRCLTQKCAMVKRSYPPGNRGKRRPRSASEYGKELREKQKLKKWYNLGERQFRKYVKEILESHKTVSQSRKKQKTLGEKESAPTLLIKTLESRLDNVIFRLGIAASRTHARQLISHRHFLVNNKIVNSPGYLLKKGDTIKVSPSFSKKNIFQNITTLLKTKKPPSWLSLNPEKIEGKVLGAPSLEEAAPPAEISLIFEYYSK